MKVSKNFLGWSAFTLVMLLAFSFSSCSTTKETEGLGDDRVFLDFYYSENDTAAKKLHDFLLKSNSEAEINSAIKGKITKGAEARPGVIYFIKQNPSFFSEAIIERASKEAGCNCEQWRKWWILKLVEKDDLADFIDANLTDQEIIKGLITELNKKDSTYFKNFLKKVNVVDRLRSYIGLNYEFRNRATFSQIFSDLTEKEIQSGLCSEKLNLADLHIFLTKINDEKVFPRLQNFVLVVAEMKIKNYSWLESYLAEFKPTSEKKSQLIHAYCAKRSALVILQEIEGERYYKNHFVDSVFFAKIQIITDLQDIYILEKKVNDGVSYDAPTGRYNQRDNDYIKKVEQRKKELLK